MPVSWSCPAVDGGQGENHGYLQERPFIIRRIQRTQTTKNCFHVWLWKKKYTNYFSWQAQRVKITQRHWGARLRNNNNTSNNNNS
ncbi:hypothetical protein Nmel_011840, partial [Mimus melanotis]